MLKKTKNRLKLLSSYFAIRKKRASIDQYLDFIFNGRWRLFKPLQVREEIKTLLAIIQSRGAKRILEIGTANGGTLFLFSRVAAPDGLLLSIDLPNGDFGIE